MALLMISRNLQVKVACWCKLVPAFVQQPCNPSTQAIKSHCDVCNNYDLKFCASGHQNKSIKAEPYFTACNEFYGAFKNRRDHRASAKSHTDSSAPASKAFACEVHMIRLLALVQKLIGNITGADIGGFVGFERTPLFADSFDLLVLCYSQQCSTLSAGVPV